MANRLKIAFIASLVLLPVTVNEVGQTFTQHLPWVLASPPAGTVPSRPAPSCTGGRGTGNGGWG